MGMQWNGAWTFSEPGLLCWVPWHHSPMKKRGGHGPISVVVGQMAHSVPCSSSQTTPRMSFSFFLFFVINFACLVVNKWSVFLSRDLAGIYPLPPHWAVTLCRAVVRIVLLLWVWLRLWWCLSNCSCFLWYRKDVILVLLTVTLLYIGFTSYRGEVKHLYFVFITSPNETDDVHPCVTLTGGK